MGPESPAGGLCLKDTLRAELRLPAQTLGREESVWCSQLAIPALGTWRQKDQEFNDSLNHIAS